MVARKVYRTVRISLLALLFVYPSQISAQLQIATDPDGISLKQAASVSNTHEHDNIVKSDSKGPILAHEVARQLYAEGRIAKLKAHLEQAEIQALEKDIRKQVLKAAELKFEAQVQMKSAAQNSSAAIESSALALPTSTSQAVAFAVNERSAKLGRTKSQERQSKESRDPNISPARPTLQRSTRFLKDNGSPDHSRSDGSSWYSIDSSNLEEAATKEDRHRQDKFHEELLRVRKHIAEAQRARQRELAHQRLLFKLRAIQTAQHLEHGSHASSGRSSRDQISGPHQKQVTIAASLKAAKQLLAVSKQIKTIKVPTAHSQHVRNPQVQRSPQT